MQDLPNPYGDPVGPTPEAPAPRRRVSRLAVTVGLASFLGLAGAGVAFAVGGSGGTPAASPTSTTIPSTTPGHPKGPFPRMFGGKGFGIMPGLGGMGPVVHGQFTMQKGDGTYQVVTVQMGTVTASSSTSITVKSADGFTGAYTVVASTVVNAQAGGISTVAKGDQVWLQAVQPAGKEGAATGTPTASNIVDTSKISSSRHGFGLAPEPPEPPTTTAPASAPQ